MINTFTNKNLERLSLDWTLIQSELKLKLGTEVYESWIKKISLIEEFNFHYENEIIRIRETIFKEILKLLEKYALEKSIDLILDSTTYLIASNSLDITNIIFEELNGNNIDLEYKDFETN